MRLGSPPPGFSNWTLRLLAQHMVALEITGSISDETVRRTQKKRDDQAKSITGSYPQKQTVNS
jgi:hypothetical protein